MVPLGTGDFRLGCSEADARTAVAVDLNVGGLAAGERVPGRGSEGTKKQETSDFPREKTFRVLCCKTIL